MEVTNADRLRQTLGRLLELATKSGKVAVSITAKELDDATEFNQGSHPNQMPQASNVLREFCTAKDEIVYSPPKGQGGRLQVRFKLPRS
ncbi:hypothetical protein [Antarctobacter heliothermus]|uniref:hypothetical protein n=1 Tax=Antarctobacter heliothermus TaxID=74033 RepID=UPI00113204B6|nr:hypothetical protein [Antarctobacter heliothermus]